MVELYLCVKNKWIEHDLGEGLGWSDPSESHDVAGVVLKCELLEKLSDMTGRSDSVMHLLGFRICRRSVLCPEAYAKRSDTVETMCAANQHPPARFAEIGLTSTGG